ncbi:MAG: hypothetical protein ACHQ1E_14180 [Ktedonobacterales bacterium]
MARIRPTGAGKPRATRRGAVNSKRAGHKRAPRQAVHKPKVARQTGPTTQAAEHPAAGSAWGSVASLSVSPTPLLALRPDQPAPDELLALVGAEQATLREALQAWGAAQDQAANRAWRRPGGLTRMAGL